MSNETNNNNSGEKQPQLALTDRGLIRKDGTLIKVGDRDSKLIRLGSKVLSKHGMKVPALIEFLAQPRWLNRAKTYDPTSADTTGQLCRIDDMAKVLRHAAYPADCKKVRVWLPYAIRAALKKGAFIVVKQADVGKGHHGETVEAILCPSNPSPALRDLVHIQVGKRVKRGEMSREQAETMLRFIGEQLAA